MVSTRGPLGELALERLQGMREAPEPFVRGLLVHRERDHVVQLERVGERDHRPVPGPHPARKVVELPIVDVLEAMLSQEIRRLHGLPGTGTEPAAGRIAGEAGQPLHHLRDDRFLVFLVAERALDDLMAGHLPPRLKRRFGAARVVVGQRRVHEVAGRKAPLAEDPDEARNAAAKPVLHPTEVRDVGVFVLAVGGIEDRPRHGLVEGPHLEVDDHVDHERLAARRLEARPLGRELERDARVVLHRPLPPGSTDAALPLYALRLRPGARVSRGAGP